MLQNHQFWWRFFPHKELVHFYFSLGLRYFAVSLIGIFAPLYLYQELGYSLQTTLLFFIFYAVVFAVMTPVAAGFAARYGVKHTVLWSVPLYLIFILLFYGLSYYPFPLVLVSAVLGASIAFYWIGMHLVFYHASNKKHRGEEVGKKVAFSIGGTVFGPLLGGLLIKFYGFSLVFFVVAVLLLFAAGFLFLSKENNIRYHFSFRSLLSKDHWKDSLFFISRGARTMAGGVIWPIFIFIILKDYFSLGIVGSLLAGVSALIVWLTGRYSDKVDKRKIIKGVVGFEAISWILRAFVSTASQIFGVTLFGAVTYGMLESPLGALEYDKAKGQIVSYFVSRELFLCIGRIGLLSFVLITDSLTGGLVLNGALSLLALLF